MQKLFKAEIEEQKVSTDWERVDEEEIINRKAKIE